jgi:hypothetical protein
MAIEFTDANSASEVGGVKALVYGGSGTGKTLLASTAPAPLLISAESGLLSLRKANIERVHGAGNPAICYDVKVIKVRDVDGLREAHAWCRDNAWRLLANAKRGTKDPRQAYGTLIDQGQMLIREFRDLPGLNVYMSAKMEPQKDEMTGITKYAPSVPGNKLGASMPYFFDEVFHLGVNKDTNGTSYRYLRTQPDIQYEAKDRSGMLTEIEYPHLGAVFAKILGAAA